MGTTRHTGGAALQACAFKGRNGALKTSSQLPQITDTYNRDQPTHITYSFGAGFPGISAVVMITSDAFDSFENSSISASRNRALISFAYPPWPAPSSSTDTVRNSAPMVSTCVCVCVCVRESVCVAVLCVCVCVCVWGGGGRMDETTRPC